mgnify:CR=1 FL=1
MRQTDLFAARSHVLINDATGSVRYFPDRVPASQAQSWFEMLRDAVPWRHERRQMYEREVAVPRLVASYRLDDLALPAPLAETAAIAATVAPAPYNGVGLNFYRDGRDSVAPHK